MASLKYRRRILYSNGAQCEQRLRLLVYLFEHNVLRVHLVFCLKNKFLV